MDLLWRTNDASYLASGLHSLCWLPAQKWSRAPLIQYTQDGSSYALLVVRLFSDDEDDGRKTIAYWETTLNYHDIVENFRSAMHTTNENGSFYEKYSHDPPSS